ncbi:MAG: GldG family protein [candidate division NC10 bacterium]|nr:GldG family protein [candidate division NC10 bacterium]
MKSWIAQLGLLLVLGGGLVSQIKPEWKTLSLIMALLGALLLLVWFYLDFHRIRASLAKRSTRYGLNVALMSLLLLGIIALVEALSMKYNTTFDLTQGKRYTLSDQTRRVLRSLTKDVQAAAFLTPDHPDWQRTEDLLRQYANLSSRFHFEFVDPDRNPGRARRYGITNYGTVILETKEKEERLDLLDEERLTNALIRVTREGKRTISFLKGHGEGDLEDPSRTGYSGIKEAVEKANYQVRELLLLREPQVPEEASVVVIPGPKKDLEASELQALKTYVEHGGKFLILLDPFSAPSLKTFLDEYGIVVGDDVIVDRYSRVFGGNELMPVISTYHPHPITQGFRLASLFPYARSVDLQSKLPQGVQAERLAETGPFPGSWAETDRARLDRGEAAFDEGKDRKGPVPVGIVATIESKGEKDSKDKKKARIVVYGNSVFAANGNLRFSGNLDLFLNSLSWLAEEEDLIAIRPKELTSTPLILTASQGKLVFWLPVVILPASILMIGAVVLIRRKRAV